MALYSGARCKNFEREVSRNLRKPPWLAQQYLLHHNPSPGDPGLARITTLAARVGNLVCLHHLPRQPAPVPRRAPQQPWPLPDDPWAPTPAAATTNPSRSSTSAKPRSLITPAPSTFSHPHQALPPVPTRALSRPRPAQNRRIHSRRSHGSRIHSLSSLEEAGCSTSTIITAFQDTLTGIAVSSDFFCCRN